MLEDLCSRLDLCIEEHGFSGVVGVAVEGCGAYRHASGLSDRERGVPNTLQTQLALASGTKGFTALAILSLVADGLLALDSPVQAVLPEAAQLLSPEVTVRQLLSHTSGMGDYLDESDLASIEDYVLPVPAGQLAGPADFWPLLGGRAPKFAPGTGFSYCNSAYVVLARLLERRTGCSYHQAVEQRVCRPAGLHQTAVLRLDRLPPSAARGYLPARGWRSNEQHVPVCGGGDGGLYSTLADLEQFWRALHAGRIVPAELLGEALRPQHDVAGQRPYGLGLWLTPGPRGAYLEGSDPGISFRSRYEPAVGALYTVLSNTTSGAWPLVRELDAFLAQAA